MRSYLVGLLVLLAPAVSNAKSINDGDGGTWDCKDDPSVNLNLSKGTFTLKGACTSVNINGSDLKVTIESATHLNLNGSHVELTIAVLGSININGNDNKVLWAKAAKGDKPHVNTLGSNNSVAHGGGGDKPAADKPADKPAADKPSTETVTVTKSGTYDCGKTPHLSLPDGNGKFKLTGTCDELEVVGGNNKIDAENVKKLSVVGSNNKVSVGGVDAISFMGSWNKVTYKKGLSVASPSNSDLGSDNKVTQTK